MPYILIADDNHESRYMLDVLLQKNGYETATVPNGKDALEIAHTRHPDLIISDILMPVMDGFTLCQQLKTDADLVKVPFVFYSATYTEPKDIEFGLSLGAARFLVKPQDIDVLLQVVGELLTRKGNENPEVSERSFEEEMEVLRRYNETLFHKLEKKMVDLKSANEALKTEIERRESTEANLRESERRLQTLLDTLPIGLAWADEEDRTQHVNRRFVELFGYGAEEMATIREWFALVHPDPISGGQLLISWTEAMENARRSGRPTPSFDVRLACKDGSFRDVSVTGAVVGNLHLAIFFDITEQKSLQEQLMQAQKLESIGNLAGGIAHDFNNILTAVTGFAGLLKMKMDRADPLLSYVTELATAGMRGAALTHQLLAFGRKQILDVGRMDLNETMTNLQKMLKRLIREDIALSFEPCTGSLPVLADANQIGQVVINLVTNARDAVPNGGSISISTRTAAINQAFVKRHGYGEVGPYAVISISDNGIGMDEETKKKIFEPFFTTKEMGKGTGLGLAVVYGIVRQHKGIVHVDSGPGKGSRFDVYLPLAEGKADIEDRSAEDASSWSGSETILVAEDDEMIRILAGDILRSSGYKVLLAKDGEAAIDIFREQPQAIDLVVFDLIMPGKRGFDAYLEILEIAPKVKVLFVTGYSEAEIERGELRNLELPLLQKPYSLTSFLRKVREILNGQTGR